MGDRLSGGGTSWWHGKTPHTGGRCKNRGFNLNSNKGLVGLGAQGTGEEEHRKAVVWALGEAGA